MNISASTLFFSATFGIIFGIIPAGLIVAGRVGTHLREEGSGNISAVNVYRALGTGMAVFVFFLDAAKGLLPVFVGIFLTLNHPAARIIAGIMVVAFSAFNPITGFKGNKGIATAFGSMIILGPGAAFIGLIVWTGVFLLTKIASLASLIACAIAMVLAIAFRIGDGHMLLYFAGTTIIGLLVIAAHHDNIGRIIKGEEEKLVTKLFDVEDFKQGKMTMSSDESKSKSEQKSHGEGTTHQL